jgi:hypothetical protein
MHRIAAIALLPMVLLGSCDDAGSREPASSFLVEPRTVDFGRYSSCDPPGPLPVRIVNTSGASLAVGSWNASCRCVTASFGGRTELAPGEHLDVAVSLAPWGMPGPHGHDLHLEIGSPPQRVSIRIAYQMDPEVFVAEEFRSRRRNPSGRIELAGIDGSPFRVLAIDPPLPVPLPEEASPAVAIEIPWATLDAIAAGEAVEGLGEGEAQRIRDRMRRHPDGRWRSLWFRATLDHPLCREVDFGLSNDLAGDPAAEAALPGQSQ